MFFSIPTSNFDDASVFSVCSFYVVFIFSQKLETEPARPPPNPPLTMFEKTRATDKRKRGNAAKEYNTCIAPRAAYRNCSGAVHVTDWAGVGPIGRWLSLRPQADLLPTSRTQYGLPFNGLHPRNPCNYIDYYSFTDPKGMKGW